MIPEAIQVLIQIKIPLVTVQILKQIQRVQIAAIKKIRKGLPTTRTRIAMINLIQMTLEMGKKMMIQMIKANKKTRMIKVGVIQKIKVVEIQMTQALVEEAVAQEEEES